MIKKSNETSLLNISTKQWPWCYLRRRRRNIADESSNNIQIAFFSKIQKVDDIY